MKWYQIILIGLVLFLSLNKQVRCDEEDTVEEEEEDFEGQEEIPEATPKEKINFTKPVVKDSQYLVDYFESNEKFRKSWVISKSKKDEGDESIAKYDGVWSLEEPKSSVVAEDLALVLKSKAKHHAIARNLNEPFHFTDKPFVVQYEVKLQEGQECGGAYIKLLAKDDSLDLSKFNDKTSYSIMFGPDKCGNDHKLHFIYRYKHPINGEYMEKHAKKPSSSLDSYFSDKKTHLYTLMITPDNYYRIYVDQYEVNSGSLLTDVMPPLNPEKEILDPEDQKPADWDDRERIPDTTAVKPDDWDESQPEEIEDKDAVMPEGWLTSEPALIPDPSSEKPSDWDEDMDGEWEAPLIGNPACDSVPGCGEWKRPTIKNPLYKGKWSAPLIDNPDYKGVWSARKIPNPDYFEDDNPFTKLLPIAAVGLELWSMSEDIAFDNFIVSTDKSNVDDFASQTWTPKKNAEGGGVASGIFQSVMDATQERPWLWAVIAVVIVLPIILLLAYCCFGSSSKSDDEAGHRKKTDEVEPDDEGSEEEEEEEEIEKVESDKKERGDGETLLTDNTDKKFKKRTKADLESKRQD